MSRAPPPAWQGSRPCCPRAAPVWQGAGKTLLLQRLRGGDERKARRTDAVLPHSLTERPRANTVTHARVMCQIVASCSCQCETLCSCSAAALHARHGRSGSRGKRGSVAPADAVAAADGGFTLPTVGTELVSIATGRRRPMQQLLARCVWLACACARFGLLNALRTHCTEPHTTWLRAAAWADARAACSLDMH